MFSVLEVMEGSTVIIVARVALVFVTVYENTRHMGLLRKSRNAHFCTLGQNLSKSSFCHIHVKEPFF